MSGRKVTIVYNGIQPAGTDVGKVTRESNGPIAGGNIPRHPEVKSEKALSRARRNRYDGVATAWRISTLFDMRPKSNTIFPSAFSVKSALYQRGDEGGEKEKRGIK